MKQYIQATGDTTYGRVGSAREGGARVRYNVSGNVRKTTANSNVGRTGAGGAGGRRRLHGPERRSSA